MSEYEFDALKKIMDLKLEIPHTNTTRKVTYTYGGL
jgi:hypothetical protein